MDSEAAENRPVAASEVINTAVSASAPSASASAPLRVVVITTRSGTLVTPQIRKIN